MKKIVLCFSILVASSFLFVQRTEAHFLANDKNFGAILHVEPNDEPKAREQSSLIFEFKDKNNKFAPQKCNCNFEIDENGKNIYSEPLFQNNTKPPLDNTTIFFTFPKIDIYQVKLVGKPLSANDFQPFTLNWNIRVDQESQGASAENDKSYISTHMISILGGGTIGLVVLIYLYKVKNLRNTQGKKREGKNDDEQDSSNVF